jgi:tetratricopeptide (TPR) repeat protein
MSSFSVALAYKNNGQLAEAEALCWQLLEQNLRDGKTLQLLAGIYQSQNKLDAAIILLEKAIATPHTPNEAREYHITLGNLFHQQGNPASALHHYQHALAIMPTCSVALYNSAIAATDNKQPDLAIDYYTRLLAADPTHALSHNNLGVLYLNSGREAEALAHFRKAITLTPASADAHNNMSAVLMRKPATLAEALPHLLKSVAISPENAQYASNLAFYYKETGDFKQAMEWYHKTQSLSPDFSSLMRLLDTLFYIRAFAEFTLQTHALLQTHRENPGVLKGLYGLLVIHSYSSNDVDACYRHLPHSLSDSTEGSAPEWVTIFSHYIYKLLSFHKDHPHAKPNAGSAFYVMGESHALSPAHTHLNYKHQSHVMVPEVIVGCKLWHLINQASNHYKSSFASILDELPEHSPLLLIFGEIDCRHNEGIMAYTARHPDLLVDEYIATMAQHYIDFIRKHTQTKKLSLFIQGVPAPTANTSIAEAQQQQRAHIIRSWNNALKQATEAAGMTFIDVYRLTTNEHGFSNGLYHLDEHHLIPDYLQSIELFQEH